MNSLNNQNVLVTRAKEQATVFADKIHQFGGNAWIADVTRITCTSKGMKNIQLYSYEWVFFTSANGVHCFFNNMKTSATLKNIHIAVVGEKTNLALMQYGRTADFIPSTYNARTMANEFLKRYTVTGRMLLVRGSKARPELVDAFSNANKVFDLLEVYKTEKNDAAKGKLNWIFERVVPDYITFTSPFAVTAFNDLFQMSLTTEPVVVCIGTTTALEAEKKGWNHIIVPEKFTIEGMLELMCRHAQQGR